MTEVFRLHSAKVVKNVVMVWGDLKPLKARDRLTADVLGQAVGGAEDGGLEAALGKGGEEGGHGVRA